MSKSRRNTASPQLDDTLFAVKPRKPLPHEFVLDALAPLSPRTRPMFGCLAVYVRDKVPDKVHDKIVLILRDKPDQTADNGVWLATTEEHHQSLRREFPNMRSIQVLIKQVSRKRVLSKQALKKKVTSWQVLPADAQDFEEAALRACELVLVGDSRIGKVPGARRASKSRVPKSATGETAKSSKLAKAPKKAAKTRKRS